MTRARLFGDEPVARAEELLARHERVILGIAGAPGSGKSSLAAELVDRFTARGVSAVGVPMDGFHLADVELDRLGRRTRKGAIDTFDADGYLALLTRIAVAPSGVVYAPAFERTIEQPIAGSIPVLPSARLVITEGNYLLDETAPWDRIRGLLTEIWFVDVDDDVRRDRLVRRHVEFGKTPEHAREWVLEVDEPNAERIKAARGRAHLIVGGATP